MLGLGVLFNVLLPWALYRLSKPHVGESHALMISVGAPMLWSLVQFARNRRVDVFSVVVISGIGLSLGAIALGGSPKLLLFRESMITGLTGLVFIGSAIVRRPLFYSITQPMIRSFLSSESATAAFLPSGMAARALAEWETYFEKAWFRRVMGVMTVAVGLIFVAETAIRSVLIFTLPSERVLLISPFVQYAAAGLLILWTYLYVVPAVRREREQG
ncbi:MAG: VC0807 family protein [Candidatus Cybelea sp.]